MMYEIKILPKVSESSEIDFNVRLYMCPICHLHFMSEHILQKHINFHSNDRRNICATCFKQFKSKTTLKAHMVVHTNEKPHICPTCSKAFGYRSSLNHHIKTHSGKKVICDYCRKSFTCRRSLVYHIRKHLSLTNPKISCDICKSKFPTKSDLIRHSTVHTGDKPYKCLICNTKFTQKSSLTKHVRQQHPNANKTRKLSKSQNVENIVCHERCAGNSKQCTAEGSATETTREDTQDVSKPKLEIEILNIKQEMNNGVLADEEIPLNPGQSLYVKDEVNIIAGPTSMNFFEEIFIKEEPI